VPQSRGRLGADDDAGEVVAGDVMQVAGQGIAAGPPLALDTEEARCAFEEGKRRYAEHKARKRRAVNAAAGCVCDAIAQQAKEAAQE